MQFASIHFISRDVVNALFYASNQRLQEAKDSNGFNCQHYAAHFGHIDVLKFFQKRMMPSNSYNNTSVLHVAVRKNHLDLVKQILSDTKSDM